MVRVPLGVKWGFGGCSEEEEEEEGSGEVRVGLSEKEKPR